ncbi:hypothetical protein Tco_0370322 [Tanacetum coccineum]
MKKARESKPKLYDVPDSDETLELSEKSRSKMLLKEQDPLFVKHKINTKPINYDILNNDYYKRFVRQTDLYCEHAYWKATSVPALDPSHSSTTVIVEVPKELPTVSMVNTSLKELKRYLTGFDQVVKERTTATAITEGTWGFEHTKASIDKDIVKTVVNLSVNASGETVTECQKCLELETELVKKKDFVDKETYDKLCKCFTTLEKHCITLEADSQLNQEIFTRNYKQIKSLKGNVDENTVKMDMDEVETLNIELEHRVTKLVTENEHLKQTYKQLYDSIKPKRVQSKEQCDALIKQVNIKSGEISDLNAKLQEQGLVIAALKNELRKLKGKALDNEDTVTHSVVPKVSKDDMEPITPKLLNKRTAHSSYIKHTQEEALVLRDIVEHVKANYPQDPLLESAFRYTKVIQDLLSHIRLRLSTSASGSQPSGNTKNDRILQTPSSNSKNKVEAHPRNVKSSLNKRNGTVNVNGSAVVQNLKKQDKFQNMIVFTVMIPCLTDNLVFSNSLDVVKSLLNLRSNKLRKIVGNQHEMFTQIGYNLETYRRDLHYL